MAYRPPDEQFVRHLTEHQSRLYAYILALLGDPDAVSDVLQDTNVALWRKAAEFTEGSCFGAWASRVAYFEVLAYRKRRSHDRHVFDDAVLEQVSDQACRQTESMDPDLTTLHRCIDKLPPPDRELIQGRYASGGSVRRLAELRGKSPGAISQALYRIRNELADCMEQTVVAHGRGVRPVRGLPPLPEDRP
jgi:RNA polymerase sigma-70 factor, ECF subfamily